MLPNYQKNLEYLNLFRQLIIIIPRYFHRNRNFADTVLGDQVYFHPAAGTDACFNMSYQAHYTALSQNG